MSQKLVFVGLLLAISMTFSMAGLNMLIVSPYLYYSHHQLDMDLAHKITQNTEHKVHVLVPIREKNECAKVKKSPRGLNFTVQCYFKKSTKTYWAENENGFINGFPAFYKELIGNLKFMEKLRDRKFDVGLAQLHFFSLPAFKLYKELGIEKHIGMSATSLTPNNLKLVGLLEKAMEKPVPPANWGDLNHNTKIGDSKDMPEVRKKKIRDIYKEATAERKFDDEKKRKEFEEMSELLNNLTEIFVNSRKELEWDNGDWMGSPAKKLVFIGGFNLPKNLRKKEENTQNMQHKGNKPTSHKKAKDEKPTVLISFGTLIDTTKKDPIMKERISAIFSAIQQFPQINFIWKVSKNDERVLNKQKEQHIKFVDWVDQRELLAEPNTIGFISHCGRNSELEAIVNGVPLICIPFDSDQPYNAEALAQKGASISIDKEDVGQEIMVNQLEILLGQMRKLPEGDKKQRAKDEMEKIKNEHQNLLKNFDILHESLNHAIEKDEIGTEIFGILEEIEKQLGRNPGEIEEKLKENPSNQGRVKTQKKSKSTSKSKPKKKSKTKKSKLENAPLFRIEQKK